MPRRFYRFKDLVEHRIINDRTDLHRKQKELGFPPTMHLAAGKRPTALFDAEAVDTWVDGRLKQAGPEAGQERRGPGRPRKPRPALPIMQPE